MVCCDRYPIIISLQESEKRVVSLQKAQRRERQFSDGRLKDLTTKYDELLAENTELRTRLKRIETRPGHHARARSHGPTSSTSSAAPSRKSSVVANQVLSSTLTKPEEKSGGRIDAKPSFLQQFHEATAQEKFMNSESSKKRASVVVVADIETVTDRQLNAWQTRTSPDLLRDHDERIVFGGQSAFSPTVGVPEEQSTSQTIVNNEKTVKRDAMKNSLLDKIRSLNVEKQPGIPFLSHTKDAHFGSNQNVFEPSIYQRTSILENVQSDNDTEEVEFFQS